MKTKVIVMGLLATVFASSVVAQENDDMYFNKKDRAKLNAKRSTEASYSSNYSTMSKTVDKMYQEDEVLNPTDSYSARNVNPEFVSRSNSQLAKEDNGDYFLNNYQYNTASNLNQFNNNFNNWYNNPWYSTSYFGPSMYNSYSSWNRPYGGYYYDSWNNPYMSPYYQNGYGMSYYNGSSWGYNSCLNGGYGSPYSYGFGYGFGSGYGSYYSGWGSSFGMGMGWGWNYWNSPTVIVINNGGEYKGPVYGKRGTRGNSTVSSPSNGTRTRSDAGVVSGGRGRDTGGRVSNSNATRQDDYYNRTWRNSAQSYPTRSNSGNNGSGNSGSSSWGNSGNNSNTRSSWTPSTSPTRSNSSFENSGSGTRSHSSSGSSSSGSGGRTRGRD